MQPIGACPPGSVGLPLLEVINTPFRGYRQIVAANVRQTFFDRAIGAADASVPVTGILGDRETSFLKQSAFATPTQNTLYSFNVKFDIDSTYAQLTILMREAYFSFRLGPKFYANVPLRYLPGGSDPVANVTASAENVTMGVPSSTLAFDVTVPEQGIDETGACIDLPTRVAMFIPSEQLLQGIVTMPGGLVGIANTEVEIIGNSFLRREVS